MLGCYFIRTPYLLMVDLHWFSYLLNILWVFNSPSFLSSSFILEMSTVPFWLWASVFPILKTSSFVTGPCQCQHSFIESHLGLFPSHLWWHDPALKVKITSHFGHYFVCFLWYFSNLLIFYTISEIHFPLFLHSLEISGEIQNYIAV